ncbi:unnamed protein product [Closterium sp. NIES-53]
MASTIVLRQRQPSVQDSLSPQQLREWAIWWGSPGGGASRARAGGAGAGGPRTRRREPLSSQQLRKRAVRWGSPGGGAWCATTGGPCESTHAGSAVGRRGGSGDGQQRQQRPLETLSLQQLHEWAVRWGSPDGGAWGTSAGGGEAPGGIEAASLGAVDSASTGAEPEEALHTFTLDSGASRCFFLDSTTVTPLTVPVSVTLADPSGGPVVAHGATVLPCPAAPSGLLTGLHLPSFAKNLVATSVLQDQPGSGLYTLTTESALVAELGQVAGSVEVASSCLCRLLTHQTLLWHHCLGHPSLLRLRGMHSLLLVSGLPRSLTPLPRSLALPCLPCVEGRQRLAPHSSSFPPTTAPLQTLHMDVWGPARVTGQGGERYFLLVVDDYTRYTTICAKFQQNLPLLWLHSDRGGEFCSHLLEDFCAAPHFLWPFAVRYAAEQLNLWPRVSHMETSPPLRWTGEVGDASAFRVWGSLSLVRDLPADKFSPRTLWCMFLGFPTDAPPWQFYHPGSRRVLSSRDVTFDESACFYRIHPHRSVSQIDPPPLVEPLEVSSDTSGPAEGGDPTPAAAVTPCRFACLAVPPGFQPRPSSPLLQPVAMDSGAAGGGTTGGAGSGGAGFGGVECPLGTRGTGGTGAGGPTIRRQETLSPERLREWAVQWGSPGGGASRARSPRARGTGGAAAVGTAAGSPGGGAGRAGAAGTRVTGAAGDARGVGSRGASLGCAGAGVPGTGGTEAAGGAGGSRGASPGGASAGVPGTEGTGAAGGAGGAGGAGTARGAGGATGGTAGGTGVLGVRLLSLSLLPAATEFSVLGTTPLLLFPPTDHSQPQLLRGSSLPAPAPHTEVTASLTAHREPKTRASNPEHQEPETRASVPAHIRRVCRPRAPAVPGSHDMTLRPSSVPQRVVLPSPPASSLPHVPDPESDLVRVASPSVTRPLATVVTDPSFESAAASALVTELVDFAALCRLDYAASLVFESYCPPSVEGELALGCDVLEDRQFELECLTAAAPHLESTLLCPEGDPDALDIPTPRTYAEAITGTYVDEVPPPGANIVNGMWIFMVKRPPGSPPAFKARYVARGFSQLEGVDFFQTFFPTPKMTTLRVLLHVAVQRGYELHSLDFSTAFLQGSLYEAIWLPRPRSFTGLFPEGTQWSVRRPVYGLRQAPRKWHDTLRTTLAALGFAPSTAHPSLFLRTHTSRPLFYVLVYVDDLAFATADTEALALVKAELQERHICNDLGELQSYLGLQITRDRACRTITLTQSHMVQQVLQRFDFTWSLPQPTPLSTGLLLSPPPSNESVEPSGPYPELVGCLITSGMGLMLRGPGPVVLTGHSDASWADDQMTHRSTQGCEAEIYAGAMAAQELRWLTYLLTDLGEQPCSPPVMYVENKAMIALCQDQRVEHRTKHIALRYFLTRELQQFGQLCLAYVATLANIADVFTKALGSSDHQRFCTTLGLVPTLPHLLVS